MDDQLKDELPDELPDDIARALGRLDADAARRARGVDAGRVADGVLARLRDEPAKVVPIRPRARMPLAMRRAAAVALLVIGGMTVRQVVQRPRAIEAWLPVAESLNVAQQNAVLAAVDSTRLETAILPAASVTVEDLDEQELQTLLETMDTEGAL